MDKSDIERMCRAAGMAPERREKIGDLDVFIADGFITAPHAKFWRFGIEKNDFPMGCYATMWWTANGEDKFDIGVPLFFEPFHNPEYDITTKKLARLNTAMREATGFIARRKAVHAKPN